MKTTKSIIVVLFALLTAQIASAYYCPSTGRWLSRDPIGEPGFQALQTPSLMPGIGNSVLQSSGRWLNRDKATDASALTVFSKSFNIGRSKFFSVAGNGQPVFRPPVKQSTDFIDYQFCHNDPMNRFDTDGCADVPGCGFWTVQIGTSLLFAATDWVILNRECMYLANHPGLESFGTTPFSRVLTIANIAAVVDHCPQGGKVYLHVWFDGDCNCNHNYVIICNKCSPGT